MPLKFRPTTSTDKEQIAGWIAADPDHNGKSQAEFWLPGKDISCFTVEDEMGTVFYVRAETVMRLHIQFAPQQKTRTARAIDEFTPWIATAAKKRGCKQLIFESVFAPLVRFLEKRGFWASPNEYVMDL